MSRPISVSDIETNDYGTDDLGVRRVFLNCDDMQMEVTEDEGQLGLTLRHFTGQRRPVDMGKHLVNLGTKTFDNAVALGKVLLVGDPAASVNGRAA